jgi:KaiC/GvpD/RAD55 family RecA-like ATPase
MPPRDRVNIPLLTQLVPGGIRPATIFGVEFDPESQWFAVATTVAAKSLLENEYVTYLAMARPRDNVFRDLSALGVDLSATLKADRLVVDDWYSAALTGGRVGTDGGGPRGEFTEPIEGGLRVLSLKVADLSLEWLKRSKLSLEISEKDIDSWPPGSLVFVESCSAQLRFNEEKPYVEWMESRVNPSERKRNSITFQGFARGVHSEWVYRRMEADWDGVVDIRVMDEGGEAKSFLRIRSLKGQSHDGRWHEIEIRSNGEAVLST